MFPLKSSTRGGERCHENYNFVSPNLTDNMLLHMASMKIHFHSIHVRIAYNIQVLQTLLSDLNLIVKFRFTSDVSGIESSDR